MRPSFEVADVLRAGLAKHESRRPLSEVQRKAANAILNCRTAALGGHLDACAGCGTLSVSYNSCRHRACPKCQWPAQIRWVQKRMGEVLNTTYFHIVFTVPHALNPLFLSNDTALYNLLMRCAWETLDQLARQPRWLGAHTGMLAVLHIPTCRYGTGSGGRNWIFTPTCTVSCRGEGCCPMEPGSKPEKVFLFP